MFSEKERDSFSFFIKFAEFHAQKFEVCAIKRKLSHGMRNCSKLNQKNFTSNNKIIWDYCIPDSVRIKTMSLSFSWPESRNWKSTLNLKEDHTTQCNFSWLYKQANKFSVIHAGKKQCLNALPFFCSCYFFCVCFCERLMMWYAMHLIVLLLFIFSAMLVNDLNGLKTQISALSNWVATNSALTNRNYNRTMNKVNE